MAANFIQPAKSVTRSPAVTLRRAQVLQSLIHEREALYMVLDAESMPFSAPVRHERHQERRRPNSVFEEILHGNRLRHLGSPVHRDRR
jgi:hypothetical protein